MLTLPPAPQPAPKRQVFVGTALVSAAATMLVGGMLAIWAQFRADARTQTGKLANGFGMPIEKDGYRATMVGQRGDGRTELVMRSGKGHLSLSHKTFDTQR